MGVYQSDRLVLMRQVERKELAYEPTEHQAPEGAMPCLREVDPPLGPAHGTDASFATVQGWLMTAVVQRNLRLVKGHNTYGQQYRNHAVGCQDEYDHPGSCRPYGETFMPDDRKSDHDVPVRDVPFVKVTNRPGFETTIVHIEGPSLLTQVPGTTIYLPSDESQLLCGRVLRARSYFYPQGWNHAPRFVQWTTCKTCQRVYEQEVK